MKPVFSAAATVPAALIVLLCGCGVPPLEDIVDTDSHAPAADSDTDTTSDTNSVTPPLHIEAECAFGADRGDCNGAVEGFNAELPGEGDADHIPMLKEGELAVGYLLAGSWLAFPDVDLTGYTHVAAAVASENTGGAFDLRLDTPDGTRIGTISVPDTDSWESFERVETAISAVDGVHTIYLVSADNGTYNGDVDWIEFFVSDIPVDTDVLPCRNGTICANTAVTRQEIRGFGGMNHPLWVGDLTEAERNTAFGNGPDQLGFSILRIFISDNPDDWNAELETARRARKLGAIVFASPWNPPESMTEVVDGRKRLRHDRYDTWVTHLNDFFTFMADNGVDLYAQGIQNEPDWGYDWTWWTPDEIHTFMVDHAGALLVPRVITPESFSYNKAFYDPLLEDAAALANFEVLGTHLYGTPYGNFPNPLFEEHGMEKELWMTEIYFPNSDENAQDRWPEALDVASHMHHALVDGGFQAYVWWYIRRSYGPLREDGTISRRGCSMAHFSKFVRPGDVRVAVTGNRPADVLISAFHSDDHVTVVLINRRTSAQSVNLTVAGPRIASFERYTTDVDRELAVDEPVATEDNAFTVSLDKQSVTTLYGTH